MPHFEWTITFGNGLSVSAAVYLIFRLETYGRRLVTEHEILVRDYCERKGIKLKDLPTRLKLGAS